MWGRVLLSSLAVTFFVVASGSTASADEPPACGSTGRPWVELRAVERVPSSLEAFVELLRAELVSRGFDLCSPGEGERPAPLATIDVTPGSESVALGIEVRDAVTAKRVARDVDLSAIPADGRPLAVALAADELLRASWAELAMRTAPPPARPVPVQVSRAVEETLVPTPPARPHFELGVGFAWEQFAFGTSLYGADIHLGAWLTRRLQAETHLDLQYGRTVPASDGVVKPSGWSAGLGASFTLTPLGPSAARWGIDAVARFDVERVTFVPTPGATATGTTQSEYTALAGLGPRAWVAVLPVLRIAADTLACLPLRPVAATDAGERVTGIGGPGWVVRISVWSVL